MVRLALLLVVSLFLTLRAQAIQLGNSREQIVAQYGIPSSGDFPSDRGMGTYRWSGWRLDIEIMHGAAQRLIFTKDTIPLSEVFPP